MTFAISVFPFYLISSLTKQRKERRKEKKYQRRQEGRRNKEKREEENDPEMEVAIIKDTSHESLMRMRPPPLPTFSPTPGNGVSPFVEQRHS